jgi:phosphatidate cytidylyltransferase
MSIRLLSDFKQRVISSCVIVPLTLLIIYLGMIPFILFVVFLLAVALHEWMAMADKSKKPRKDKIIGLAYLSMGLGAFLVLRQLPVDFAAQKTLAVIFMIWAADTGAFAAGKTIGGKKLCPLISPGKTWAGLIGGLLAGGFTALVFFLVFGFYGTALVAFFMGVIIACAAQAGDLIISIFKRRVGVKDTGTIIPGHGGILDRIDSLLLAAPVYLMCLHLLYAWMAWS